MMTESQWIAPNLGLSSSFGPHNPMYIGRFQTKCLVICMLKIRFFVLCWCDPGGAKSGNFSEWLGKGN